jgi:hypothetical protein
MVEWGGEFNGSPSGNYPTFKTPGYSHPKYKRGKELMKKTMIMLTPAHYSTKDTEITKPPNKQNI